jgi:hypothetical protein
MELISNYENAVNAIIEEFKKKQELTSNDGYWIGNQIGEVYDFGDAYTFDFNDVLLDIKENAVKGEIFKWRNYMLRIWQLNNMAGGVLLNEINYRSWIKGCPRLTDDELNTIETKWKNLINEIAELGKAKNNSKNENK